MSKSTRRDRGDGALFYSEAKGLWIARVDLGVGGDGRRRYREVTSTKYDVAARKLRELRRQKEDHGDIPTATMTVEAWLKKWLRETVAVEKRPKTRDGYRSAVNTWLIPHLGKHRLDRLEAQHVRDLYKAMRAKGRSEASVLKVHNVLAKALKDAKGETTLTRNVTEHIKRPKPAKREAHLSTDDARAILASVRTDPLGARWAAALYLGARQGEVLGMEWSRVNLEVGTLDLSWQLQRLRYAHGCGELGDAGWPCGRKYGSACPSGEVEIPPGFEVKPLDGGLCLTKPKSEASERLIPLPPPMLGWLLARQRIAPQSPHDLVFTRADGRPLDPRPDLAAWKALLTACGLPDVPLHAARHTTATLLREAGVDPDIIRAIMGHSSVVVTQGYLHVDLTLARAALAKLNFGDFPAIEG